MSKITLSIQALLAGAMLLAATAGQAQDADTEIAEADRVAFQERRPEPTPDPDAVVSIFAPIIDAAVAEAGAAWIPRDKSWGHGAVIRVCFMNGTPELNRYVATHAAAWNQVGADVMFDFGPMNNVRTCAPGSVEDVRVAYNTAHRNFSNYGSDSIIGQVDPVTYMNRLPYWNQPSMQLDVNDIQGPIGRGLVIHEFGHALGLYHEHQKPVPDGCENEFNWPRVYETMWRNNGWPREEVDAQVRPIYDFYNDMILTEGVDRDSVMLYAQPASSFIHGRDSICYIASPNNEISDGDMAVLRYTYSEEEYRGRQGSLGFAAAAARDNGQHGVARALALYSLPRDTLSEIAGAYERESTLGFNPGRSAADLLNDAINGAIPARAPAQ